MTWRKHFWEHVVVTGGAGFVGSNLALEIQKRCPQAHIIILDDFRSGSFANLREFRGDCLAMDASVPGMAQRLVAASPTLVFHLASITDTRISDDRLMVHDNVQSFRAVLSACLTEEIPLVYASSAATYGLNDSVMTEDTPAAPANVYGFSKMILDNMAFDAMKSHPKQHLVGLRYFNVYGPREAHKGHMASMIYQLYEQMRAGNRPRVFKFGEQKRDFVYVKDVVEATLLGATAKKNGIYNVGCGEARSFNDLIAVLNEILGTSFEPEYFDNPYEFTQSFTQADLTVAKKYLGYTPKFMLEDGVADYVKWLQQDS